MCGDYVRGVVVFCTTKLQYQLWWVLHYVCSSSAIKTLKFPSQGPFSSCSRTYGDFAKLLMYFELQLGHINIYNDTGQDPSVDENDTTWSKTPQREYCLKT